MRMWWTESRIPMKVYVTVLHSVLLQLSGGQKPAEIFFITVCNIVINDTLAIKFSGQKYSDFFKILFGFKEFLLSLQSLN